jgi:hypothetical protein
LSYEYEIGNEPSAGRAVAHGVLDVLTLGIWEIVGTPVEAIQGKKNQLTIYYDSNNRVMAINQPPDVPIGRKDNTVMSTPKKQDGQSPQQVRITKTETEEKLDQIKDLKDKGKITDDEYALMRKEILNINKTKSTDTVEKIPSPASPF